MYTNNEYHLIIKAIQNIRQKYLIEIKKNKDAIIMLHKYEDLLDHLLREGLPDENDGNN